ncbi:hypothetical protein HH212_20355 [Massilia forsythiae]|uniref:Uncharacterized protein n=1 Tax=Massilia forsythiae TaxID=2728020 RepID=A0A7Z2ZTY5_9BURK|nr:hypothetical protein [Massilia forsythiae]QJE02081.1 hypothetical protein HH212_20355 [Massilia forsythiae]
MDFFKRIAAAFGAGATRDNMAGSYPPAALDELSNFRPYPPKVFLKGQGVFAYRLEFGALEADAAGVVGALASEFGWPNPALLQEGHARRGDKSVHFSIRSEFGGVVVVIVTNCAALINKIDALNIVPPPPWLAFPDADPSSLGSLQGAMEYWWDWLFSPFWSELDARGRVAYLSRFAAHDDWLEFLSSRAL